MELCLQILCLPGTCAFKWAHILLTRFEFDDWMDQGLVDGGQTMERTFFGVIYAVYI